METRKKAIATVILSIALIAVLAFGALGLSGCGKKNSSSNATSSGKVTKTVDKKGGIKLETSSTVHVDIPKGK